MQIASDNCSHVLEPRGGFSEVMRVRRFARVLGRCLPEQLSGGMPLPDLHSYNTFFQMDFTV